MKLGFGASPRGRKVYVNHQYPECLWYFWDHGNNTYIPILHESLTGYLRAIYLKDKDYKNKANQKINFVFDCEDDRYILEVGLDTIPARKLIEGCAVVDASKPITIEHQAGDKEPQAIFINFYEGNERLRFEAGRDDDFLGLLETVMNRINGTTSQAVPPAQAPVSAPRSQVPSQVPSALPLQQVSRSFTSTVISDEQRKQFAKIAKDSNWEVAAIRAYLGSCGYTHSSTIASVDFEKICLGLKEDDIRSHFHRQTGITASETSSLGTWEQSE